MVRGACLAKSLPLSYDVYRLNLAVFLVYMIIKYIEMITAVLFKMFFNWYSSYFDAIEYHHFIPLTKERKLNQRLPSFWTFALIKTGPVVNILVMVYYVNEMSSVLIRIKLIIKRY